jgi:hypothetical protein
MMTGDTKVRKDEIIVGGPADPQPAHRQRQHRGRAPVDAEPVVLLVGQLAPEHRAVVGVAQPDHAAGGDRELADPPAADERAVRAAGVLQDPRALLMPQDRVPPRHAPVGHDDVGFWVAAQAIRGPGLQSVIRLPRTHHERRAHPRGAGTR